MPGLKKKYLKMAGNDFKKAWRLQKAAGKSRKSSSKRKSSHARTSTRRVTMGKRRKSYRKKGKAPKPGLVAQAKKFARPMVLGVGGAAIVSMGVNLVAPSLMQNQMVRKGVEYVGAFGFGGPIGLGTKAGLDFMSGDSPLNGVASSSSGGVGVF